MRMTRIILVKNLDENNVEDLVDELVKLKLNFQISLANKAVIVDGDNDAAYQIRVLLQENGFIIE